MYPRNSASPEPLAIGAVVQISDGAVQTSGVTVRIKPVGVAEGDGAGTTSYSTDGVVCYTPTQAETNYTSFILIAKKTGCIPVSVTVVTSAESTAGTVKVGSLGTQAKADVNAEVGAALADAGLEADLADVLSRLPAALVSGRMDASVGAMASNVMTAAATAADFVTELQSGLSTHSAADVATAINSAYSSGKETAGTIWHAIQIGQEPAYRAQVTGTPTSTLVDIVDDASIGAGILEDGLFRIATGNGKWQTVPIITDTVPSVGVRRLTFDEELAVVPDVGDYVELIPLHTHSVAQIASGVRTELTDELADIATLADDWANGGRLDLILDARASQTSVDTLQGDVTDIGTDLATSLVDTGTDLPAQIAALLTTAGAESYRADGSTGSVFQLLYEIHAEIGEFAITGTTKQHKRLDGTTNAFASTLDDATNPTSVTRSA